MSATYEGMSPGGHETYATSIFSKIKTYLDDLETLEKTASGAIATFDDGSDLPMPKLEVAIEPQQDLHGYDSPWVGGGGKNKCPINESTISEASYIVDADIYIASGTWTFSFESTVTTDCSLQITDSNGNTLASVEISNLSRSATVTINTRGRHLKFYGYAGTYKKIQLERGLTVTTYEPYSNICPISGWDEVNVTVTDDIDNPTVENVYTIDLDGTRYGGTLDVVSGVLTVTRIKNTETFEKYIGNDGYQSYRTGKISNLSDNNPLSNMVTRFRNFAPVTISEPTCFIDANSTKRIYVALPIDIDITSFELVYELATPITYQLTPTQVKSLLGQNNIWADTGDIEELIYFRNAKSTQAIKDIIDTTGDVNVKQTPNTTSMDAYPILFSASDSSGEVVGGTYKNPDFYYRTDLNRLILNNEGIISVYHTSTDQKRVDIAGHRVSVSDMYGAHTIMEIEAGDITLPDVQIDGTTYRNTWDGMHSSLKNTITYFYTDLLQIKSLGYKADLNLTPTSSDRGTISLCTYTYQTSNTPQANTSGFCFTFINSDDEGYGAQIAISYSGVYKRSRISGSWYTWSSL